MRREDQLQLGVQTLIGRWLGESTQFPHHYSAERRAMAHQAELLALPSVPSPPIQDLNPTSPTFGQFLFMLDYDALP